MHIDPFDEDTYVWILKSMDYPFIPTEWNSARDRVYSGNQKKITSTSVFGRYLSKMKLNQWNKYSWADTDKLNNEINGKKKETEEDQEEKDKEIMKQYVEGAINEAQLKTYLSGGAAEKAGVYRPEANVVGEPAPIAPMVLDEELGDPAANLTQEDKVYLAMKWGRLYQASECVELEKKYNEMQNSFDIQDSDTEGTLILICKTYLKMNQALDIGDIDAYNKLSRTYDTLRKSAKFQRAQNKEDNGDVIDSVGELVALCEREGGFIPRFCTDIPQDKVDATLKDMNGYTKRLVTNDLGFGQQIEDALKKIQIQKEMEAEEEAESAGEGHELDDDDIMDFKENILAQNAADDAVMKGEK